MGVGSVRPLTLVHTRLCLSFSQPPPPCHCQHHSIAPDYYGAEEDGDELHFRRILHWYQHRFQGCPSGASLLFPIGALRALRRLTALSGGRALVVSGDKGNNSPEQFKGLMDPHIAVHGSFSVMVRGAALCCRCSVLYTY